jgi:hypothetical protein
MTTLGWGSVVKSLDKKKVEEWLLTPQLEPANYPDTAKLIADWIDAGNWEDIAGLCRRAWRMKGSGDRG